LKELLKSISKLTIPTVINLVFSILRNKVLAVVVGPIGLGVYSQIINMSNLIYAILPIGAIGLIRYTSNYYENNRKEDIAYLYKYFFKRNLIVSFVLAFLIVFFRQDISFYLFSSAEYSNYFILLSIIVPINLLFSFIDIYLRGIRKINVYVLFLSINSLLSIIFTIPLIIFAGIYGAIIALVSNILLSIIVGFIILKKYELFLDFKVTAKIDSATINNIYKFGFASLISLVLQNVVILLIRSIVAAKLSLNDVGLFQSVYSISTGYFGIFFTLMSTYSIPKLSALNKMSEINNEVNTTIKLLLLVYTPIIVFFFVFRSYAIKLLYSSDFVLAKGLLIYQAPAEFFKALSWVMGLWLIPTLRIKQWMTFEILYYCLFFLFFYLFIEVAGLGLKSTSISYLISYIVFFIINYIYFIKTSKFKFSRENLKIILSSFLVLMFSFLFSYLYEPIFYYFFFPIIIIWLLIVYKKADLDQLVRLLRIKMKN
jgi:PST family polysaccharide transporter